VPFVVTLDGQGHLISLVLDSRAFDKDLYRKFTFTDFGSPRAIKPPPASSVVPATAKNYEYFNSN